MGVNDVTGLVEFFPGACPCTIDNQYRDQAEIDQDAEQGGGVERFADGDSDGIAAFFARGDGVFFLLAEGGDAVAAPDIGFVDIEVYVRLVAADGHLLGGAVEHGSAAG